VPLVEGKEGGLVAAAGFVQEFLVGHQWPGRARVVRALPPGLALLPDYYRNVRRKIRPGRVKR
jgi:hypothetical protein